MVTWGDPTSGGKSSKVAQELKAGVSSETLSRISQRETEREREREIHFLFVDVCGWLSPVQIQKPLADQGMLRNNGRSPVWIV